MIEVRAFIQSIEFVNKNLLEIGASLQGEYSFRDYIYQPRLPVSKYDLNKEFIRIRAYHKTNWNQKSIEFVHKIRSVQGLMGSTKIKKEFGNLEEAKLYLGNQFEEAFSFGRKGYEYKLNDLNLFVEDIEGLPASIEVIAPSEPHLNWLLDQIKPVEVVYDSVPRLIDKKVNYESQIYRVYKRL